jgi:hypothetical protein
MTSQSSAKQVRDCFFDYSNELFDIESGELDWSGPESGMVVRSVYYEPQDKVAIKVLVLEMEIQKPHSIDGYPLPADFPNFFDYRTRAKINFGKNAELARAFKQALERGEISRIIFNSELFQNQIETLNPFYKKHDHLYFHWIDLRKGTSTDTGNEVAEVRGSLADKEIQLNLLSRAVPKIEKPRASVQ